MRIIIGYYGSSPENLKLKHIIRKTTYGVELDFYDMNPDENIPTLYNEKFRFNAEIYDHENFYSNFSVEKFILMNRDERFWELHEIMEHYWKKSTGMDKMILQEIIGILVSQVKWQMGQFKVSESVLNRNVRLLEKNTEMVRDEIILGVSYPILFNPKLLDYFEQIYIA
ncbi:MAG: hypothetical protein B2I18_04585 [Cuniculiplasma sp. C_DKE]|jgi:predicted metal-dependent hydrolase|uniref:Predicted metal-dependent hydrolase n=1 Tax=Cuniculiplasma divulgatum TaxID=1673428 RepID=A0A1R4A6S7_9ARCH|nr:DUF309 domain-containing protein [Cuniculiplasma divulgatum]EQB69846.1 MAG: hypothetical protein AMDU5_GPLC00001G0064 [Thermoplasmatales archaeon Gpl]MCI2411790.1 DUF309 domain-containing protein [Cuniculiplasma sp.]OWP54539.1 MAG: hypothetical protein B2I18_04585 [Cuniculiplasma sp. C_DKE]WMT48980.1 MAG: DUF309 domain-containing protein [Thermoplasmatales archaeon]SJK84678.1 predicted metal-dependent hydrolase [Cuniculiplasma divulgatum]